MESIIKPELEEAVNVMSLAEAVAIFKESNATLTSANSINSELGPDHSWDQEPEANTAEAL